MTNDEFMTIARMTRPNVDGMAALIAVMREIGWLNISDVYNDPGRFGRLQAAMLTAASSLDLFVLHDLKAQQ